jgi:hypothetical protein
VRVDLIVDDDVLGSVSSALRSASAQLERRRSRTPDFGAAVVDAAYADASRVLTDMADWLRQQTLDLANGVDSADSTLLAADARLAAAA